MKVTMKQYEKQAVEYAHRFKSWEHVCIAKDAYLEGFRDGVSACEFDEKLNDQHPSLYFDHIGQEEVEVELHHQLTGDMHE